MRNKQRLPRNDRLKADVLRQPRFFREETSMSDYIMDLRVSKALELVKANAEITDAPAEEKAE